MKATETDQVAAASDQPFAKSTILPLGNEAVLCRAETSNCKEGLALPLT